MALQVPYMLEEQDGLIRGGRAQETAVRDGLLLVALMEAFARSASFIRATNQHFRAIDDFEIGRNSEHRSIRFGA